MRWLSLVILCTLLSPLAAAADEDLQPLLDKIEATRREHAIPGVGMAIVSRDKVLWVGGFGVMDLETERPVTADTIFRIGSVTKMFTALGLIMLDEEHKLRLDGPVREFAPDAPYTNPHEQTHPITIAQLLEHTAGLQDLTKAEFEHSDPKPLTLEEGLAFEPASRTVRWKPGLHAVYSNAGYGLAGYVLQTVAKMRYEDFIAERIFQPLGMASSGFFLDDQTAARLATGYETDATTPLPYWHMLMRPFGGINSTPRDMASFVRLLLERWIRRRPAPGAPAVHRAHGGAAHFARRPQRPALRLRPGQQPEVPQGRAVQRTRRRRRRLPLAARLQPRHRHGVLHRDQCVPAPRPERHAARDRDLDHPRSRVPPPPPAAKLSDAVLQRYVGDYDLAAWRFAWTTRAEVGDQAMRVTLENGVLYSQVGTHDKQELVPVSEQQFRRRGEPTATCAFVEDVDGTLYFEEDESWRKRGTGPAESEWPGAVAAP